MADFDPDKYLAADAPAFDPDAYLGNPEPADHGLSERLKRTPLENAVGPVTDYWPTYQRMNREGRETMSHGVEQIGKGEFLKGIGNTALGAAEYVGSPINAAYRTVVGQPIEDVTGIPREYTEFGAQMLTPGLGFTKMPGAKSPVPRIAPKPEANGPLGVTLSEGQATREMDAIRRESAARTGQLGPGAERTAQDFAAQQAEEVARARETVERSLDPAGGQQLAEGPYEAAEMAGNSFRREAAREKAGVTAAYDEAKALPGEVPASGVVGMGNLVRNRLPESVIIDPQLTPAASKMIDAIDETISKLRIPNKAELNAPDPMEISGVSLRGLDQVRKKLSEYRRAAYANNPTDGRAASAVLDAYDAHIDHLVNSGQFSGDPRAVKAWNAARAAHSDYMKTFGKQSNDPVGRVIQKIIGDKTNPPETANALADHLFGASGVNPSDLNIRVAQRMKKVLGENSPEWAAVRQGLFSRLVEPNGAAGATKIYKRIDQFLNRDGRDLANVLFTPEQRRMIEQYGDLHRALEVPKGGYNHSETSTFLAPILHKLNGAVSAVLGSIIGHTIAPGAHGLGEGIGAVIANRGTEAVKNFKNARQIVEQMPILERQIREWKKEAARTFNNQNRTSGSALASRTALVSKSLERMGVDGSYLLEHLQGTVPSAAGDQVQGQGRRHDQPDQGKTGKAHGGSVSRSVITDHVRRAFAGGGDVYNEIAPVDEAEAAREAAAHRLRAGVMSDARRGATAGVAPAAGLMAGFAPGSGIADVLGQMPDFEGGKLPSFGENVRHGEYGTAGLQALGAAGDMMMAMPVLAPLGAMAKAPRAATKAKKVVESVPRLGRAAPEEIARAAEESRGMTQPQLRALYNDLGLSGGEPSQLVRPALAEQSPEEIARATALKLEDREALNQLSEEDRKLFQTGKLKGGFRLPSQIAAESPEADRLQKEVVKAQKDFDKGNKPSLFDLSPQTLQQTPDVEQFPLPRVAPKITERLQPAFEGGAGLKRLESAAEKAPIENWGWYNLDQARDAFYAVHGPVRGEQAFQAWVDSIAGTSMVNPIDNNIRSASYYLQRILKGEPLPQVISVRDPETGKMVQTLAGGPPAGYGAKSQVQHAQRVRDFLSNDLDPVANPKPISFRQNLLGNWMPRTVDTHDIRNMLGMPYAKEAIGENSALLPGEYTALEDLGAKAAKRAGVAQAPQQAATWIGGGEYTGLKSHPVPFMEALNRRIQVTARIRGESPEKVFRDMIEGRAPLFRRGGRIAGFAA